MFFRNPLFILALVLTFLQQVMLAMSTYFIAMAGASLSTAPASATIKLIVLFFIFAIAAYLTSSLATYLSVRASNQIWQSYAETVVNDSTADLSYSSEKNKKKIVQWINGEASSSISQAIQFFIGFTSVGLNIGFTIWVFYVAVGLPFTASIAASLALSTALVMLLRKKIGDFAGAIQSKRLNAMVSVEVVWNQLAFGDASIRKRGEEQFTDKLQGYFSSVEKYTILEQIVACLPITLSVLSVLITLWAQGSHSAAMTGVLVAILPRSLQLFGNIHSLSIFLSQYYFVSAKIRNLKQFAGSLERHCLNFDWKNLAIYDVNSGVNLEMDAFYERLIAGSVQKGRYLLTGVNGAGKSTLLKYIKTAVKDSILYNPEVSFSSDERDSSTGQSRMHNLRMILNERPDMILLDEWDANLDARNTEIISKLIDENAKKFVVIEVRHKYHIHVDIKATAAFT